MQWFTCQLSHLKKNECTYFVNQTNAVKGMALFRLILKFAHDVDGGDDCIETFKSVLIEPLEVTPILQKKTKQTVYILFINKGGGAKLCHFLKIPIMHWLVLGFFFRFLYWILIKKLFLFTLNISNIRMRLNRLL